MNPGNGGIPARDSIATPISAAFNRPLLLDGREIETSASIGVACSQSDDDAEQLRRHAALWRADARHWRMATVPDAAQLRHLLAAWQVVVIDDGRGGYEHNAALLVIDPRGRLVRIFDDADVAGALDFARALQRTGSLM